MNLFIYIGLVAAAFVGLAVILGGAGLLVRRLMGAEPADSRALVMAPWLGWGLAVVVLQLWHLVLPVNGCALGLVTALGAAGLMTERRSLMAWARRQRPGRVWLAVILMLAALWLADQTTTQVRHPDSGLYHLASIKWAFSYPIVPGLGNLRNILAYNNSYFLYVAMLNVGPFVDRYHHLASGLPIFLLLALSLVAWWNLLVERQNVSAWRIFDAAILVPVVVYAMGVYGSSPSPDVGVWVLTIVVASELLRLLEHAEAAREDGAGLRTVIDSLCFVLFLSAVGVTVKLSYVATGLSSAVVAVTAGRFAAGSRGRQFRRPGLGVMAAAALTLVPWVVRGYITSGYPAYPSTFGGLPVTWRMSRELAESNARWLYAWGRMPEQVTDPAQALGHWHWVWLWLNDVLREPFWVVTPLLLACIVVPLMVVLRRQADRRFSGGWIWLFLAVPLASLAFWFFTSPQVRFASASFLALGMGAFAIAARRLSREAVLAALASLTVVLLANNVDLFDFAHPWRKDAGPVRKGQVVGLKTDSGLTVYVPAKEGDACWDAPLPSTSGRQFLDPRLRLRVPGDLSDGFVIDEARPGSSGAAGGANP